jgi:hypothetical protein
MGGNWFQGPSACAKQKEALHERSNEYDAPTELGNDRAMLSAIDMALLRELVVGYIDGLLWSLEEAGQGMRSVDELTEDF